MNGIKSIRGKRFNSLAEIEDFENNFDQILSETRINIQHQQDDIISVLSRDEAILENRYNEGIALRIKEIDENIAELWKRTTSSGNGFGKLVYHIEYRIASGLRDHRIRSPLKPVFRE